MQTNWTTTVQYYQLSSAQVSRLSHAFSTKNSWLVSRVRQGLNYQEVTNIQPFLVEFPAKFLQIPQVCLKIAPTCNNFCYNDFFSRFYWNKMQMSVHRPVYTELCDNWCTLCLNFILWSVKVRHLLLHYITIVELYMSKIFQLIPDNSNLVGNKLSRHTVLF